VLTEVQRPTVLVAGQIEQHQPALLSASERTNRLLMLMQLHANGDESEPAYRTSISTG